jgi:hypothetical protein
MDSSDPDPRRASNLERRQPPILDVNENPQLAKANENSPGLRFKKVAGQTFSYIKIGKDKLSEMSPQKSLLIDLESTKSSQ